MNTEENENPTLSWLDKNFLEKILRHNKNDERISIVRSDFQNAVPKGDNYGSIIVRVEIEYSTKINSKDAQEKQKCSLIVKSMPKEKYMQMWLTELCAFERELHIYDTTMPEIKKLFLERTEELYEHLAPDFYVTDRPATIILEDLRPHGYKMADRRQGLDLDHSVVAIRTLAKLHASSMVLHVNNPEALDYYKETMYIEENRKRLAAFLDNTLKSLAIEVGSWIGFEHYVEKLQLVSSTAVDRTIELMKNQVGSMKVLNHGDFWTNNMLFRYEDGKVADLKMVDFQLVRFASPALDIQFFLHTSPSQDVLEENRELLIEEYLESINSTLKCLRDERVVTLEEINKEMKDKAYYGVITSCIYVLILADPEDAPNFSELLDENHDRELRTETMDKACAGKKFRDIFQRRLPKFVQQGLI